MKLSFILLTVACTAVVGAQVKAPPPNAKDVSVPSHVGIPHTESSEKVLTVEDAVKIALSKQPTLESARQAVIAAEGRVKQVRSKLLPQLGIGGTYYSSRFMGNEPRLLELNVPKGYGASAGLTQLIYDANHSSDLVKQSKALQAVAKHDFERAQEDLIFQVLVGCYLLNEAHELVSVNQRNVDNRNSQLELARARFKSGIGGPDDVLTAQTAKGNAVISLIQAQNTEDSARESLLETLGLDAQEKVQFQVSIPQAIEGGGYETWVEQALSKRPEILRAKSAVDAASYGAKAASTTSAPSLSTTISWSSNDPGFPAGAPGYGIGFILSVPVFDGERASGARKEANATLKAAKSELVNAQLQVKTDVSQAYLGVQSAEQQVEAAQTNVANAKESLRIAEGRYKSGLGLFLDIINAQTALLSAETNSVVATAELSRQRASLRKAIAALEP